MRPSLNWRSSSQAGVSPPAVATENAPQVVHVSVQVVNYRTKDHLIEVSRGAVRDMALAGVDWTLRVLDNASGDDLQDLGALLPDAPLRVVQHTTNVGFGAGHNILAGLEPLPDLIFILNPDVRYLEEATFARLWAIMRQDRAVAVGPRLVRPDGRPQVFDHGELYGWRAWVARQVGGSHWAPAMKVRDAAWVSGAAALVAGSAFRSAGGFDERFFLYKEEEDLCVRLRATGRPIRYAPSVLIQHIGQVVASHAEHFATSEALFRAKYGIETRGLSGRALVRINRHTMISHKPVDGPWRIETAWQRARKRVIGAARPATRLRMNGPH